jgi:hypothetical protein
VVYRWISMEHGMILTGENLSTGRKTLYSVGGRWMNKYGAWNDTDRGNWSNGVSMEHCCNNNDRRKPKYPETNLPHSYFLQHRQGTEPGTPLWQVVTMVWPCVMWRRHIFCLYTVSTKRKLSQMWYCSLAGRYTLPTRWPESQYSAAWQSIQTFLHRHTWNALLE